MQDVPCLPEWKVPRRIKPFFGLFVLGRGGGGYGGKWKIIEGLFIFKFSDIVNLVIFAGGAGGGGKGGSAGGAGGGERRWLSG